MARRDVVNLKPELNLRVVVKGPGTLHSKGLDSPPGDARVPRALRDHAFDVHVEVALRREEDHVTAALEGHLHRFAALEDWRGAVGVELIVGFLRVEHPHVIPEPRDQVANSPRAAVLRRRLLQLRGLRNPEVRLRVHAKDLVCEVRLDLHDAGPVFAQVLLNVAETSHPGVNPQRRVAIEDGPRSLHGKARTVFPEQGLVLAAFARKPLDVDHEYPLVGEAREVTTARIGHLNLLILGEEVDVSAELVFYIRGVQHPRIVPEKIQEHHDLARLRADLRISCRSLAHGVLGEDLAVQIALQHENVQGVKHKIDVDLPHALGPDPQLRAHVHRPGGLHREAPDRVVRAAPVLNGGADQPLHVPNQQPFCGKQVEVPPRSASASEGQLNLLVLLQDPGVLFSDLLLGLSLIHWYRIVAKLVEQAFAAAHATFSD
mmetsp:Transcript_9976/g.31216  ORF Transcript_9976/g.31216 Transcript_9976/m.31216 type:complete len:432 (-) Transcript_9976:50-1345(-)